MKNITITLPTRAREDDYEIAMERSSQSPQVPESPHIHRAVAPARAVLFDFDFTLADSSEGIVVCMNHALGRLGLPPAPADAIRRTIGLDLGTALGILAGEEWRPREDEFLKHFVRKADEVMVARPPSCRAPHACSGHFTMPATSSGS